MANQYGLFWNSVGGDRTYSADSFEEWAKKFFTTGVFNGDLQVTPDTGMDVLVGTGYTNVEGKVRFFDTQTSFTISPASGTYPRIDTIVVQRDDTNREITLQYIEGAYSGNSPSPTAPVRSAGIYELVLAEIYVAAGATQIDVADITDKRADSTVCGWVTGSVDSVDVAQLTTQAQAQFQTWFDAMKNQLSQDAAGNLQLEVDALAGSIATFETDPATNNYAVGEYLIWNNQLYKVIAAITAGDALAVGTNIQSTSAGDEIKQLNDDLIDTGNTEITSGINYRKYHGVVFIHFNKAVSLSSTSTTLATLPAGFRPFTSMYYRCIGGSGRNAVNVVISTTGVISAYVDSGTGTAVNGNISFIADN